MPQPVLPKPRFFRFGPYQLDALTGELRNGGIRIKTGSHSAQILLMLLERAGEPVFRSDIQARLWPTDVVVEFDAGINTAVKQLRAALNDSAEKPRYIETVSRRGYRFVAEVEAVTAAPPETAPIPEAFPNRKYPMALGALALLAITGILWWQRAPAAVLTDQDVLVLADFSNSTGDPSFDGALRPALAYELERSPFLTIMDDQTVSQTLQLMGLGLGEPITKEIANELCVREGRKATLVGSIGSLGASYQIGLQAINCQTGATLARELVEVQHKEQVLRGLANAATLMRAKLGESLASIQRVDRPLLEATTPSLEAFKTFQRGQDLNAQGLAREAIPYLRRAIELDPNFAAAYMFLGVVYGNTGQMVLRNESLIKAFALIERVSERERLFITGEYHRLVTGDLDKAIDSLQMLVRSYPRFVGGHHLLGLSYAGRGEFEKALEQHLPNARREARNPFFQSVLVGTIYPWIVSMKGRLWQKER